MLPAALAIGLLTQGLQAPFSTGDQEPLVAAVEVRGTVELSAGEAFQAARREALGRVRSRWEERAQDIAAAERPAWLPSFATAGAVRDWVRRLDVERSVQILDRSDEERFHEFGESYQTTLVVAEDPDGARRAERSLRRDLREAEKLFLMKSGGSALLWVLLGLLGTWLDRLSRGYMTGRLWLMGIAVGAGVPAVAFLL